MSKHTHSWPHTIRIIVFSCLIGGAAGVLGTALTTVYLSDYVLQLGDLTEPLRVAQERPRALPESYADALGRVKEHGLSAIGLIYDAGSFSTEGVSVFSSDDSAIALTSDGWALAATGRIGDIAGWGPHECKIDKLVPEPLFGFSFIHCAITGVSVVDIGNGYDVSAGDQLFVVTGRHDVSFTYARSVVWGNALRSSDIPSRRIVLSMQGAPMGAAVLNVYGELVGMVDGKGEVVPFEHIAGAFRQVLEEADHIAYPALGARGIDLTRSVGVDTGLSQGLHAGFVLFGAQAVERGGAAFDAGLLEGDVLLDLDGVAINESFTIDDLIATYSVGDEIQLTIERAGDRLEVNVTLGELVF